MEKNRWLIVFLIMVVAFVFRFQNIASTPPGLYPDEAMDGNNALYANATGHYQVFYTDNNGREGLFMDIQAISLAIFGNQPWALRIVSALFGLFTVLGVYFLAKRLFNWQIGAMSSFMLAISFWHTLFSRIGFRAIMAPFFLVWALFFFWRGLQGGKFYNYLVSGIFWGLGFYSYISFRVAPFILIIALLAYWQAIHKKFDHAKYLHARNLIIRGTAIVGVVAIIVALPLGYYFLTHPADFFGRTGQISVFASSNPIGNLVINSVKTLGMFNFVGDWNWRQNFAGSPELFWPIGILFLIGFTHGIFRLVQTYRKEKHFPTVQVLLFSWFFIGLLPVVFSNEGIPHALRAIIVAPVVFIFAGEGLWWVYEKIKVAYEIRDPHIVNIHRKKYLEGSVVAIFTVVIFLTACMFFEYDKYFNQWANNPNVPPAFNASYVTLGQVLNQMPINIKKYVLVNAPGVEVVTPGSGQVVPMPAQTVMFITDTWTPDKQAAKNIFYLTPAEYAAGQYDKKSIIIRLDN
jgi:4-amino-4-deoxy-L-arabinose transferase-like glycosyltransferase